MDRLYTKNMRFIERTFAKKTNFKNNRISSISLGKRLRIL